MTPEDLKRATTEALAFEDDLMAVLNDASRKRGAGDIDPTATEPGTEWVPTDPDTERQAYVDLVAFIAQHKDPDTAFSHVSLDDFMHGLAD